MKNTKPKVRLWSVLTGLTAILTVAAIVGNIIANQYATTLNVALNASTYKIIHGENTGDTEYFKKGFASDEEREAYEAELCATVEAEGAALLTKGGFPVIPGSPLGFAACTRGRTVVSVVRQNACTCWARRSYSARVSEATPPCFVCAVRK